MEVLDVDPRVSDLGPIYVYPKISFDRVMLAEKEANRNCVHLKIRNQGNVYQTWRFKL